MPIWISINDHKYSIWSYLNYQIIDLWKFIDYDLSMKTNRKNLSNQRQIIDKRLRPWLALREEQAPGAGWIKAIRGALGISTRQLADFMGTSHSAVVALEKREAQGKVTLEMVAKFAQAMGCKFVYGIVPEAPWESLDSIVSAKAKALASELLKRVEHSMSLEKQGSDAADSKAQLERLAFELKTKMDSRIWDNQAALRKRRKVSK